MRVEKAPSAKGSAEQWVRERFSRELLACRKRNAKTSTVLVTIIDGDAKKTEERIRELADRCKDKNISFRDENEPIAIAVPCRNIETWIRFLDGENVTEDDNYPKLSQEKKCKDAVKRLVEFCQTSAVPDQAPLALKLACAEYNQRILPVGRELRKGKR
jgi:hypothetical protein